jgi:hypothetical protein
LASEPGANGIDCDHREADPAHETATELEALVSLLPNGKAQELAHLQVKASHKQAKEFRELAQKIKES